MDVDRAFVLHQAVRLSRDKAEGFGDVIDFLGQPITAGARIVYPQRGGSMLWLVEAEVVEVGPDYLKVNRLREGGERPARASATIHFPDRTVVVSDRMDS